MEFVVEKSDLLKELAVTESVVGHKSTIPVISTFMFEAVNNQLLITATDLDVSLRTFCAARVFQSGSCTIPARKLYEYVRLLRDGEITIKLLANHWVQLRSGRSHTRMVGMARANFPALPLFPAQGAIRIPAAPLRAMISKAIIAVSLEESRYTLRGALLVIKPESMTMVATDGHRMAHIETACKMDVSGEMRVLIPRKAMGEIHDLLNATDVDTVGFAKDDSTLFFAIGTRLLTSRQLTGNFPNYEAVLPRDLTKFVEADASQLARAVQRVSQFSDERSHAIQFKVDQNLWRVSSSSPEAGESEDSLETTYGGDPLAIRFNSRYLLEFLKVAGAGNVRFHFQATDVAGEFRQSLDDDSGCKYRYIVMPMRS
jgi:DNA polymerase III subunit beta